jgi:hypothetical protein
MPSIGKSIYPGEAYGRWCDPDKRDPQDIQMLTKAHAEIRSLYLAGAPLFTKQLILDVADQLQKLQGSLGTIFVKGVNGAMVEFAIETGRIHYSWADNDAVV